MKASSTGRRGLNPTIRIRVKGFPDKPEYIMGHHRARQLPAGCISVTIKLVTVTACPSIVLHHAVQAMARLSMCLNCCACSPEKVPSISASFDLAIAINGISRF